MIDVIKKSRTYAYGIVTVIFTFIPESFFANYELITPQFLNQCKWLSNWEPMAINIIVMRILCFVLVLFATSVIYAVYLIFHRCVIIHGDNYTIRVEYGDILRKKNCKRVINFDECFTTQISEKTADIKPGSICGQYLAAHPDLNIQELIKEADIKPARSKSRYQQKTRYDSGTIVPNGDDLLMAFAKLDEKGKGRFFLVMSIFNAWNSYGKSW